MTFPTIVASLCQTFALTDFGKDSVSIDQVQQRAKQAVIFALGINVSGQHLREQIGDYAYVCVCVCETERKVLGRERLGLHHTLNQVSGKAS